VPFILSFPGAICSLDRQGVQTALNFFFRRPEAFDGVTGLSGLYSATSLEDGQWDGATPRGNAVR
jgi:esterase/lipase superfamily enzyme